MKVTVNESFDRLVKFKRKTVEEIEVLRMQEQTAEVLAVITLLHGKVQGINLALDILGGKL